ncbi:MAG: c-type cytochrome [Steroidobacteraceae bacterium]
MRKRVSLLLLVIVLVVVGFAVFAWRSPISEVAPPGKSAFAPELVAQGEVLAGAGYCAECHTARGGQPYAGGYALQTPFGALYSTNITPDVKTGIGAWSEAAFRRAMHEGVARDGSHLLPAFPFDHFTKLTDADVAALYAYFMTREPVRAPARKNGIPFPLNIRALQAGWKVLFFHPERFVPTADRSVDWNRGAYLAEGISHCGACHTPRNFLGAEKRGQTFAGATIDNWVAPPLTKDNPSPVPWSEDELFAYLRNGVSHNHGTSFAAMGPVVHDGLHKLPAADVRAIAVYFAGVDEAVARSAEAEPAVQHALAADQLNVGLHYEADNRLYAAACASCHYNGASGVNPLRPDLALNSAVNLDDPANLIHVMLYGIDAKQGAPGVVMPAFSGFTDTDLSRIAAYLRATRTTKGPWPDLTQKVAAARAQDEPRDLSE